MDLLYSVSLLVSLAAGSCALLAGVIRMLEGRVPGRFGSARWQRLISRRAAGTAIAIGSASLALSIAVHARWGHGPGAVHPLGFARLLSEHEAFPVAAAILALGLVANTYHER